MGILAALCAVGFGWSTMAQASVVSDEQLSGIRGGLWTCNSTPCRAFWCGKKNGKCKYEDFHPDVTCVEGGSMPTCYTTESNDCQRDGWSPLDQWGTCTQCQFYDHPVWEWGAWSGVRHHNCRESP